jgi:hypothetical protein
VKITTEEDHFDIEIDPQTAQEIAARLLQVADELKEGQEVELVFSESGWSVQARDG